MRQWTFVGRTGELARLRSAVITPGSGGLILSGVAGIGKSRLLAEAIAGLPGDRYAIRVVSATIAGAGLPFGGLAQVLPSDPPAGSSPAGLLRWAVDKLHAGAAGHPLVLVVDDAHLLDQPSAALVKLLDRGGATLLGTLGTGDPVPAPIGALWTQGLVEHAELKPLDPAASGDLLAFMLGAPVEACEAGAGYDAAGLLSTVQLLDGRPEEAVDVLRVAADAPAARRAIAEATIAFWGLSRAAARPGAAFAAAIG